MIHSRIARYLRTRDWHTAVLELAIVVLGMYLGIEASNWNAARLAAADERYYADRLVSELDESVRDFQAANAMPEGTIVDGALEELRTSGRMALIRNRVIREGLSRYYAQLQSSRAQGQVSLDGWNSVLQDI